MRINDIIIIIIIILIINQKERIKHLEDENSSVGVSSHDSNNKQREEELMHQVIDLNAKLNEQTNKYHGCDQTIMN